MPQPNQELDTLTLLANEINKNLKLELEKQEWQAKLAKEKNNAKLWELDHRKLSNKLDTVNAKNKQLENELEITQRELILQEGEIGLLEQQNARFNRQRDILQLNYQLAQATIRKFIATAAVNNKRERERERAKLELKSCRQQLKLLQAKHGKTSGKLKRAQGHIINAKQDKKTLEQKVQEKDRKITKKTAYINKQQTEISKLKKEIQQLKTDNYNLSTQLQQAENRADNLQVWKDSHVCVCPNICCVNGDYDAVKQQRDNYQQQLDNHVCPTIDNSELERLREEAREKDKKIEQLEQEIKTLKDKPPVVDNSEVEKLLSVVEEKEQVIRELEVKLATAKPQEIKVESEGVQELRNKLVRQEQRITRLHVIYLLILSVGAFVGLVKFTGGKISKKKPR